MSSSVALVDPLCGSPLGHNFPTLTKYGTWLRDQGFSDLVFYIPRLNQSSQDSRFHVRRTLPWCYESFFPVRVRSRLSRLKYWIWDGVVNQHFPKILRKFLDRPLRSLVHIVTLSSLERAFNLIFQAQKDAYVFPGVDFYSLLAIENLAKKGKIKPQTRIAFRFMAMMENWHYSPNRKVHFLKVLQRLQVLLPHLVLLAETEAYARILRQKLGSPVLVNRIPVTFPDHQSPEIPAPRKPGPWVVSSLGGARPDKGYFDFLRLSQLLEKHYQTQVVLEFQEMSPSHPSYDRDYEEQLGLCRNLRRLPSRLSDQDLALSLQAADLILLHYDPDFYQWRGSAILFDSLAFGKPLLGRAGTGFASTIEERGLGITYRDDESFQKGIAKIMNLESREREQIATSAREYCSELDANFLGALRGEGT